MYTRHLQVNIYIPTKFEKDWKENGREIVERRWPVKKKNNNKEKKKKKKRQYKNRKVCRHSRQTLMKGPRGRDFDSKHKNQ